MSDAIESFEYQLLGRLQQDCQYNLGAGFRNKKHLWALDEALQIEKMKELYENLPVKPEWITPEAIAQYEQKMLRQFHVNQKVSVWINTIIGSIPAIIVRDMTCDISAASSTNSMPGESVYEVKFTAGPHPGTYSFVPARDLRV